MAEEAATAKESPDAETRRGSAYTSMFVQHAQKKSPVKAFGMMSLHDMKKTTKWQTPGDVAPKKSSATTKWRKIGKVVTGGFGTQVHVVL